MTAIQRLLMLVVAAVVLVQVSLASAQVNPGGKIQPQVIDPGAKQVPAPQAPPPGAPVPAGAADKRTGPPAGSKVVSESEGKIISAVAAMKQVAATEKPLEGETPEQFTARKKDARRAIVAGLGKMFGVDPEARDRTQGDTSSLAILFWVFAFGTIGGALFVITRRNLIAAVMGMVGTFFAVAGIYMMLYANFLAVVQMLVYAGAIMVLFVFVVMILNKPEDEPWALVGLPGKALAGVAMLYLTYRLGSTLWSVKPPEGAMLAPGPVTVNNTKNVANAVTHDWGSTGAVGTNLFDQYLFPFEAVSILLLVAVVGAIAIARPLKDGENGDGGEGGEDEGSDA